MAVPRSAACTRGWFPPATFQLRLRSLRSIIFVASPRPRHGKDSGYFYATLHETPDSAPAWRGAPLRWSCEREERLEWPDIDVETFGGKIHKALKSVVVKIWFTEDEEKLRVKNCAKVPEVTWGIYFSGLWCLGTHPPAHGRLPPDSIVLHMSGSYFSSASHIKGVQGDTYIPRYLHIGTAEESQAVGSYDTPLLLRLHRIQRALRQQEVHNARLKKDLQDRGVDRRSVQEETASCHVTASASTTKESGAALPSLRHSVFARRMKLPTTRLTESHLSAKLETLKMRISLLRAEKARLQGAVALVQEEKVKLVHEIAEKTSSQMQSFHDLSKEKASFNSWLEQFKTDTIAHTTWTAALRQQRFSLIHSLTFIYPLGGDLSGKKPTLRWVTLPPANELRDYAKNEVVVSVAIGWLAHVVQVISRILDMPLRYPVKLMGSQSTIRDDLKKTLNEGGGDSSEFPLYLKSSSANDWARFEYGIYLLNKNLSQLRWQCGLVTSDLRPMLQNLAELVNFGKNVAASTLSPEAIAALPNILTRTTPPPKSSKINQIVIRDGRATIPGTSKPNPVRSPPPALEDTQFAMDGYNNTAAAAAVEESSSSSTADLSETESVAKESEKSSEEEASPPPTPQEEETKMKKETNAEESSGKKPEQQNNANMFWCDVTNRTIALSNPSSFQRPRSNH